MRPRNEGSNPLRETEGNGQSDVSEEQPADTVRGLKLWQEQMELYSHSVNEQLPGSRDLYSNSNIHD